MTACVAVVSYAGSCNFGWPGALYAVIIILVVGSVVGPEKSPGGLAGSSVIGESGVGAVRQDSTIDPMVCGAITGIKSATERGASSTGGKVKTSETETGDTEVAGVTVDRPREAAERSPTPA